MHRTEKTLSHMTCTFPAEVKRVNTPPSSFSSHCKQVYFGRGRGAAVAIYCLFVIVAFFCVLFDFTVFKTSSSAVLKCCLVFLSTGGYGVPYGEYHVLDKLCSG